MKTKVTTIVASPGGVVKRRVWDYECSPMRRAFGGLASRTVREGGVVVSLGDGAGVNQDDVKAWMEENMDFLSPTGVSQMVGSLTRLANAVLLTGGTLREDVQEHNTQEET